ncbi:hypothetical protein Pmani_036166 [Petrolisthes manimaculis]|uniref:Uncharacterized protein n=1 Tax=Petrolisthes manimaculis TaxID=1843537 RepID=A0AAE1TMN3_9EUCA|nr:hypothetical protein Pmani_036166 [Petrolisthes manimaculis]
MLSEAFCKWCDSGGGGGGGGSGGMEVEVRATTEVVASVRSVATAAAAASSVSGGQTLLQFFPDAWLTTATDSLFTVITMSKDISLVLHLLDLFWGLIWTCSIIEPGSSACHLAHTWLALATLPWMVTEVKLMDLKLVNARQFTHWSAKLKWNEDVRVKSKSIRVIAVLPGNVAPRWRCQVVRAALSEREAQVMPQIATCFPLMVQQVGSEGGQQLVGEVVGAVINSPDTATVRAAAHSFRQLLCALLHLTSLRIDKRPLYGLTGGVLVLLVICLVIQDRTALAQAHLTIHALASTLHITLRDLLYTRHRHSLAQVLCEIMNPGEVAALLNHVAEVFH